MLSSPIILIDGFIPPLKCQSDNVLEFAIHKANSIITVIEQYYNVKVADLIDVQVGSVIAKPICDNSAYINRKWTRKNKYDFTGYIPLCTYNNTTPFDISTDVYGGELVFKTFKFKHAPNMGDLLIFPSAPNFIHYHDTVKIGQLQYIKFYVVCNTPYVYDYRKFNNICSQW